MPFIQDHHRTTAYCTRIATEQIALWSDWCHSVSVIFDIGANVGVYSVIMADAWSEATVVAFEPVPQSADLLERHCVMNGLQGRLWCYRQALWCSPRRLTLGLPRDIDDTGRYSAHETRNSVDVEAVTLTLWCHEHQIRPDFIKIDVEGAEAKVLCGMEDILQSCRWLVIEDRHYKEEVAPVWEALAALGYLEVPHLTRKVFESDRVFENTRVVPATFEMPFQPRGCSPPGAFPGMIPVSPL